MSRTPYLAHSWRISVEVDDYEHARLIAKMLISMKPRRFQFSGLDEDGEPLWDEDGDPSMRPEL